MPWRERNPKNKYESDGTRHFSSIVYSLECLAGYSLLTLGKIVEEFGCYLMEQLL
jgi:hypothetical protein